MPTYWTRTLIPTARQVPAEAVVPSHQLMLRAGLIRKLGAGVYDYLPLGLRTLRKVMNIIRDEMDRAGAVEVFLPSLQPIELWEQTGRRTDYGQNLFVVTDRHGSAHALGPTHEEVVTELIGAHVESYKQLPLTLYQIQTKFRDEFRPRFGVLRSREFQMKDAYSFHLRLEGPGGLDETYQKQYDAYRRIFTRCGLPYEIVEAESGPIGGSASHEFMVPSPTGEDTILKSDKGNYAANVEKCEIGKRDYSLDGEPTGDLEKIHTPNCPGIDDVITFFKKELKTKLKPQNMLKTLVYEVHQVSAAEITKLSTQVRQSGAPSSTAFWSDEVVVVVRGDHEVNEAKLRSILLSTYTSDFQLELMNEGSAKEAGFVIGFVGPHASVRKGAQLFVDSDAAKGGFWVTGANEIDHHVKHFNWKRDVLDPLGDAANDRVLVADIRNAADGDPSPKDDGGTLRETKGIEIGHVFKLGDKYTRALNVTVLDENNERRHPIMGCYGIGVNRIVAAAIERTSRPDEPGQPGETSVGGHDDNGIVWPASIAPFTVLITPIKYQGRMREVADQLAGELEAVNESDIDVLIDDRDERPGVKFKDADLIGIPVRVTIGEKALADGSVEVKRRADAPDAAERVPVERAAERIGQIVHDLIAGRADPSAVPV